MLNNILNTRLGRITAQNRTNLNRIADRQLNRLNKVGLTMASLSNLMTVNLLKLSNHSRINKRVRRHSKSRRTILIPRLHRTRLTARRDLITASLQDRGSPSSLAT